MRQSEATRGGFASVYLTRKMYWIEPVLFCISMLLSEECP